ncbi:MAG TPA: ribbon-helix-helix domain-containing protein [Thermodesulfobacteriota bacterium]|nr:ribbon-helix-helix domain-containing protein [Thermodesulfobacteriota bacterium]
MTAKKISKTVYITPEQDEALKKLQEKTKVPQSEYIREGIELALKKYQQVIENRKKKAMEG